MHWRIPCFAPLAGPVRGVLIAAILGAAGTPAALAASPFDRLSGSWSGGGRATFENGQTERLRCNAHYSSSAGGRRLGLSIRCASPSSAFELRSDLAYRSGRVSGIWHERTLGASGDASGRADSSRVVLRFTGTASGNMALAVNGRAQTVTIATQGTALRGIRMSLRRR